MMRLLIWLLLMGGQGLLPRAAQAEQRVPDAVEGAAVTASQPGGTDAPGDEEASMRISMEFQDASLRDILKLFSQQTGINIIAGDKVSEKKMTIYFEDVTVLDALDQILLSGNLQYQRKPDSDIYVVTARSEAGPSKVQTITRVYRLKYARVSESVLAKAAAVFGKQTPFESATKTTSAAASGASGGSVGGGEEAKVGIDLVLAQLLTEHGKVVIDSRTNSLILTDIPENFPRLEGALAALDIRTSQVLVDAELIETTLSKLKELGLEWGSGTEGSLISFLPGGVDVDGAPLSAGRLTRFPFGSLGHLAPSGSTPFPTSTLSFNQFQGVLKALETDSDTKVLARPKVLTLDNESALIRLTSDEAIGFLTSSQSTTGTTTSTPERATTGVFLVVTPQVNEQGYVTMIVEPVVTKTVASKVSPPTGQATPRDPKTRSSRTIVRIKSGDTLVVGGLIDRSDDSSLRRVPVLSGIPVLGEAFKKTELNNTASELIVFVTPKILDEAKASQVASSSGSVTGPREQEPAGARQDAMEQSLNVLERQPPL